MINFNKYNDPNEIIQIKNNFYHLAAGQKRMLVKELNSSQRKVLIKIINTDIAKTKNNDTQLILEKMQTISKIMPKLTRSTDKRSLIANLSNKISRIVDDIACFFNIITANKANRIIKSINLKNSQEQLLPNIKESELNKLLFKARENQVIDKKINLAELLNSNGFATKISNIKFSNKLIGECDLNNMTFNDCNFDFAIFGDLKNVCFEDCYLANACFENSLLEDCKFNNCEMQEVMFNGTNFNKVTFSSCSLICNSFEDATISECEFYHCVLPGTHFLEAVINKSSIIESNLENTVFFDKLDGFTADEISKTTAVVTKPISAILVNPKARGITVPKAFMKLDQSSNMIPLRISLQPTKVKAEDANREVEAILKKIGPYDRNSTPIPQRLMKEITDNPAENPHSASILRKVAKLSTEVDSFFLPGGEDVPPALYGQEKATETDWGNDYRRSLLELSMIYNAFNKGIPLFAVCRGFQIYNVYFGAQLVQHVEGHKGTQELKLNRDQWKGLYDAAMKDTFVGACFHHQAVPLETAATEHLETVVEYEGLIKAADVKEGGASPAILLQFHPEFYNTPTADSMTREFIDSYTSLKISDSNEVFFEILKDSAAAYRNKKALKSGIEKQTHLKEQSDLKAGQSLIELDKKRSQITESYIKNYYLWRKELLNLVVDNPEIVERYFNESRFVEEREAIENALKYDASFYKDLVDKNNLKIVEEAIKSSNPKLDDEPKEI
jgi:gamma-glutamyl-gamma-aminobutyrate hydrolase PuuD/uncharacterized protein YjbI with pentapeptide repeats